MRPLLAALIAALTLGAPAGAQPVADHLKCYKVKDAQPKAVYTADVNGLTLEPGCTIKVPGNLLCVQATKTGVTPTPPGTDDTGPAGRFLCYKLKCPKGTPPTVQWSDQFGTRVLTPGVAKTLCAPEIVPSAFGTPPIENISGFNWCAVCGVTNHGTQTESVSITVRDASGANLNTQNASLSPGQSYTTGCGLYASGTRSCEFVGNKLALRGNLCVGQGGPAWQGCVGAQ